jgi:hypothetical protein
MSTAVVEVRDHALWPKHIHGNDALKTRLLALPAGALIELRVDGVRGTLKKMDDGADGRPTPGIKGIGAAKDAWHDLQASRGSLVSIEEVKK